jgi:hypothetical protein
MFPVSLDCSFLIAPLVFYSVYLIKGSAKMALSIAMLHDIVVKDTMVSYKKQELFILREDLCSLRVFLVGSVLLILLVFCVVCFAYKRFCQNGIVYCHI